jgi:hypothetical protein
MNVAHFDIQPIAGQWISARDFSRISGLSPQTLANLRAKDRRAGKIAPNHPIWRYFAGTVRYWYDPSLLPSRDLPPGPPPRRGRWAKRQPKEAA